MLKIISREKQVYLYDPYSNIIYLNEDENLILENTETRKIMFTIPNYSTFDTQNIQFLVLNITNRCNMRCTYCAYSENYYFERYHSHESMSFEVAKKAIDLYFSYSQKGYRRISFYGGEPTTDINLVMKVVDYVKTIDDSTVFYMNTNLYKISEDIINFLIKNNFILYISVDGFKNIHNKYRKDIYHQNTYDNIYYNLNKIFSKDYSYYKKSIAFLATLTKPYNLLNIKFLYDKYELFKQPWSISSIMPFDNYFCSDIDLFQFKTYEKSLNKVVNEFIDAAINNNATDSFGHHLFSPGLKKNIS